MLCLGERIDLLIKNKYIHRSAHCPILGDILTELKWIDTKYVAC
jgi:hypothetical protein